LYKNKERLEKMNTWMLFTGGRFEEVSNAYFDAAILLCDLTHGFSIAFSERPEKFFTSDLVPAVKR